MPIAFTELTAISQYDNANSTTFNTPSLTATAGSLYLILIQVSYGSANPRTLSSVSGGGLGTWTIISGASVENSGQTRRAEAAYATSTSPGAGAAVAVTWSGATTGCAYAMWEITGFNPTSPVGQASASAGTGSSGTPSVSPGLTSSGLAASCQTISNEAMTAEAGWTSGENNTGTNPNTSVCSAMRNNTTDTGCTFSWTTSGTFVCNIVEIKVAGAPPFEPRPRRNTLLRS